MKAALKIPYALRNGRLIHVSEVESGAGHGGICPACSASLIAKKGSKMRHHFAHQPAATCNAETALHRTAKILLFEEISCAISEGREIPVSWKCSLCESPHAGNLLKRARSIYLEHTLGPCRPDLTLFDEQSRPVAVIEVVVSHEPEEHVREFCTKHKIGLLEYHLEDDCGLEVLRPLGKFEATIGNICTREKCPQCKAPLFEVIIHVVTGNCWKCRAEMKIAFGYGEGGMAGPDEFTPHGVSIARKNGAVLRERYSNVVKKRYLANTCQRCGTFCGDFYLHDFWHLADDTSRLSAGVECAACGWLRGP